MVAGVGSVVGDGVGVDGAVGAGTISSTTGFSTGGFSSPIHPLRAIDPIRSMDIRATGTKSVILFLLMRIPAKMDTDSRRWWTAVPADDGHLFQSMMITC
jgi:hypothetical protein